MLRDLVGRTTVEVLKDIIGGCCGTGPDHIRAIRAAIDRHRSRFS
jgi:5-methyltetrahydrofolate--homocysteine methyltransferase